MKYALAMLMLFAAGCSLLEHPENNPVLCSPVGTADPCPAGAACVNHVCTPCVSQSESCNGIDDDCDHVIDNGFDVDGDGFSACGLGVSASADCDDADPTTFPIVPGGPMPVERCDGRDNTCGTEGADINACSAGSTCEPLVGACVQDAQCFGQCRGGTFCTGTPPAITDGGVAPAPYSVCVTSATPPAPTACPTDGGECPTGSSCDVFTSECIANGVACLDDAGCPAGAPTACNRVTNECVDGAKLVGATCTGDAECDTGLICVYDGAFSITQFTADNSVRGHCTMACRSNSTCAALTSSDSSTPFCWSWGSGARTCATLSMFGATAPTGMVDLACTGAKDCANPTSDWCVVPNVADGTFAVQPTCATPTALGTYGAPCAGNNDCKSGECLKSLGVCTKTCATSAECGTFGAGSAFCNITAVPVSGGTQYLSFCQPRQPHGSYGTGNGEGSMCSSDNDCTDMTCLAALNACVKACGTDDDCTGVANSHCRPTRRGNTWLMRCVPTSAANPT